MNHAKGPQGLDLLLSLCIRLPSVCLDISPLFSSPILLESKIIGIFVSLSSPKFLFLGLREPSLWRWILRCKPVSGVLGLWSDLHDLNH